MATKLWVGPSILWVALAISTTMAAWEGESLPWVVTIRSIASTSVACTTRSTWATRASRKAKRERWRASAGSIESSCCEIRWTTSASGSRLRAGESPSQSSKDMCRA